MIYIIGNDGTPQRVDGIGNVDKNTLLNSTKYNISTNKVSLID